MTDDELETDEEVLARLAGLAARLDPVPADVEAAARASLAWARVASELADLVYDSAVDEGELVGIRGGAPGRQLTFEGPGLTVEIEVAPGGGRLVGQLVPPQAARIEVRHLGGSLSVESDELGRFSAERISPGPVSLRCRACDPAAWPPTATDWVAI
jgi:hypothetical protein